MEVDMAIKNAVPDPLSEVKNTKADRLPPAKIRQALQQVYPGHQPKCPQRQTKNADRPFRYFRKENDELRQFGERLQLLSLNGDIIVSQMIACSSSNPCGIPACPKCCHSRASKRIASIFASLTQIRKSVSGTIHNVVISCRDWEATPADAYTVCGDVMHGALDAVKHIPGVQGYTATIDARVEPQIAEEMKAKYPDNEVLRLANTLHGFHWHLIVVTDAGFPTERLKEEIKTNLALLGHDASVDSHLVQTKVYKGRIVTGQFFGLLAYNEKLSVGSTFNARHTRMLQRSLCGIAIHNDYGVLSHEPYCSDRNAVSYATEYAHVVNAVKIVRHLATVESNKHKSIVSLEKFSHVYETCRRKLQTASRYWQNYQKVIRERTRRHNETVRSLKKKHKGKKLLQELQRHARRQLLERNKANSHGAIDWLGAYEKLAQEILQTIIDALFKLVIDLSRKPDIVRNLMRLWLPDLTGMECRQSACRSLLSIDWLEAEINSTYLAQLRLKTVLGLLGFWAWSYGCREYIRQLLRQARDNPGDSLSLRNRANRVLSKLKEWSEVLPTCRHAERIDTLDDALWIEDWSQRLLRLL
ncbi:MAG: hypothetical protein KatS3mg109_0169 [Pirellulaceae bacterium]|nr:MAG: hypothetical protein KatS3mg109_0169 [Pirellulaceae bacterium]